LKRLWIWDWRSRAREKPAWISSRIACLSRSVSETITWNSRRDSRSRSISFSAPFIRARAASSSSRILAARAPSISFFFLARNLSSWLSISSMTRADSFSVSRDSDIRDLLGPGV
jgi:hypothetical protein